MRNLLLLSLFLGYAFGRGSISDPSNQIEELSAGRFMWQVNSPVTGNIILTETGIEFPAWNSTVDANGHTIPVRSKLIFTSGGPPQVSLSTGDILEISLDQSMPTVSETAIGMDLSAVSEDIQFSEYFSTKLIREQPGLQLWAINMMGARHDAESNSWLVPDQIELEIQSDITSSASAVENSLYLNQSPVTMSYELQSAQDGLGVGKFKLYLLDDGIYRIWYNSLVEVEDFPEDPIESRSIMLRHRGEQQPIYVEDGGDGIFDSGDYFDFIGKQNYFQSSSQYFDPFSDISVYWLDWGGEDGLRLVEESGSLVDSDPVRPTTFWDMVHIEKDSIFDRLGQVDTDLPTISRDHYFWNTVNSGQTKELDFFLADPFRGSSENIQVSIGLHGLTYSENAGEVSSHTLFAFVNGNSIGEGNWVQQEEYTLISPSALNLSHGILSTSGINSLEIFAPVSSEAGNYDRVVINWMEIGYEHLLKAHNNSLRFRKSYINPSINLEYEIKGFTSSDLVIYKEGLSRIMGFNIRENWETQEPQYNLVFQDQSTDATPDYWASTTESLLEPVSIVADTNATLRQQDGDYIIITIPEFMPALDEYLEFKSNEGWNPIAVSIADIYDEFNYGISSPHAIKAFLKYANNHWPSSPSYVLLLGDAIANPQLVKRDTQLRNIPTFYMQTYGWGAAEADYWFSLINGDDYLPDLHIGRIPCSDADDLAISLTKSINYGAGDRFGMWQNELINIAGLDTVFKVQTDQLRNNIIPKAYIPNNIYIDRNPDGQIFWGDTESLADRWNEGKLLINFLGHGGGAVWADRSIFVRDDIQYLDPETPPAFITSMTCFTGSFAQARGLGEVILTESPAGAIGWFGSSGVGWIINDYLLIQPLLLHLLSEKRPVGELINIARMEYFLAYSGYDYLKPSMLFQYNFLGDPTTVLAIPESADLIEPGKAIYSDTEELDFNYIGAEAGEIKILPINAEGNPWLSEAGIYQTETSQQYLFDQEDSPPSGESRAVYTLDRGPETSAIQGYSPYSISVDWFEHEPPSVAEINISDQIELQARYHSSQNAADSMIVVFSGANNDTYNLTSSDGWWSLVDSVQFGPSTGSTNYYFKAFSAGLFLQNSDVYRLYLPDDISLTLNDIREGHEDNLCGVVIGYSLNGVQQGTATLQYSDSSETYDQSFVQEVIIHEGSNTLFVPSFFGLGLTSVFAAIQIDGDAINTDDTLSTSFQPSYFQILPEKGISFDQTGNDTIALWTNGKLYSSHADTAWLRLSPFDSDIGSVSGVELYSDSMAYHLETSSSELKLQIQSSSALFFKDEHLAVWQHLEHSGNTYILHGTGLISPGEKIDSNGPDVSMMMEGQLFFDGDYLLKDSQLHLIAEDENGFSWNSRHIEVLIDDSPVAVQLGDTTETARILSISADLDLTVGEHQIAYRVSDALGNWSEQEQIIGVVAGEGKIVDYGNFPNPFEGETLIIYELTQPLDDVSIDFYTIAGYKVLSIDSFNARVSIALGAIGYHEVPWNGRDRNGDFVANGVYFYRIRGKLDDEDLVGPIGKMVKNR